MIVHGKLNSKLIRSNENQKINTFHSVLSIDEQTQEGSSYAIHIHLNST